MSDLWREMSDLLVGDVGFVAITLFSRSGSAPRAAGAKMLVKANGQTSGTIGGGKLEGEMIRLAQEVLQFQQSRLADFDLTGSGAEDMDLICGGSGEILLDYYQAGAGSQREIFQEIIKALEKRQKSWLVTCLTVAGHNIHRREQCLLLEDGTYLGGTPLQADDLQKIISGPARNSSYAAHGEGMRVLVEPVRRPGTLFIFGAGHLSREIALVAGAVDFQTVVLDDRAEFLTPQRFPHSQRMLLDSFQQPLPELPLDEDSYLVIVTRGHSYDKNVLGQLLNKPAAYLGMIGSKRKRDLIYTALQGERASREALAGVHAPIGLAIGAETPQEIAVSIVAELILVRAGREKDVSS